MERLESEAAEALTLSLEDEALALARANMRL